ncbi:hypothetical protein B0T22DRAFT_482232 [Podospora appendiculata]|uniref:F-box domain-containing protein n=1 Tax=Podospora appendiculata TaxID=314037 RepID=A0AAE1CA80_9PEZI|nr:hypothetical protein B0T22DRAFT_482232 [Podospora appendiculata]
MPRLTDLPVELIIEIAEHLFWDDVWHTGVTLAQSCRDYRVISYSLASLSQTCQRLRWIVQPILFRHPPLNQQQPGDLRRIIAYARAVTERPDLAGDTEYN